MKKFLVTFIIGIVFMAIGTTSLIFEINEFERVDQRAFIQDKNYFNTEEFKLNENKNILLNFDEDSYIHHEIEYDDSLGDNVKISISNNIDYKVLEDGIQVYEQSYYNSDFDDGINRLEFIMDGLKQKKLYDVNMTSIIVHVSYDNRDRIQVTYQEDEFE